MFAYHPDRSQHSHDDRSLSRSSLILLVTIISGGAMCQPTGILPFAGPDRAEEVPTSFKA